MPATITPDTIMPDTITPDTSAVFQREAKS